MKVIDSHWHMGRKVDDESREIYTRILTIIKGVKGFWQRSLSCVREYRYNDNLFGDSPCNIIDACLGIKVWKEYPQCNELPHLFY